MNHKPMSKMVTRIPGSRMILQGLTKSTKKSLPKYKKRKTEPKTKEDGLCDEVVAFLKSNRNKSVDADELFGQNKAGGLRNITDNSPRRT